MDSSKRLADRLQGKPDLRDGRSRKVVLVAHCVLNQNSRVAGAAERAAAVVEPVTGLPDRDVGILQMPCPELCAFGLDRAQVRVESELRTPAGRALSRRLAQELVKQVRMYLDCGIHILGILGKNGSSICGVEGTWSNGLCCGSGAFMEEVAAELEEQRIVPEMSGIRDNEPDTAIAAVDRWLAMLQHK